MRIAYFPSWGQYEGDRILFDLARSLAAQGYRLAGAVQINQRRDRSGPCDMDLQVLAGGPSIRISQDLGPGARGCRLDMAALEAAVGHVAASLSGPVDCLLVNKFGKHEADGRGFRPLITEAIMRDIPVLVGVNRINLPAFAAFSGGLAQRLDPEQATLGAWVAQAAGRDPLAA